MSFASEMATMATELLTEFGAPRDVVLVVETPTGTEYSPGEPDRVYYDVLAVVLLVERIGTLDNPAQGTLIDDRRRRVIMSVEISNGPTPVVPKSGDKLMFDDYTWTILAVGPVSPGGETILYKLDVER